MKRQEREHTVAVFVSSSSSVGTIGSDGSRPPVVESQLLDLLLEMDGTTRRSSTRRSGSDSDSDAVIRIESVAVAANPKEQRDDLVMGWSKNDDCSGAVLSSSSIGHNSTSNSNNRNVIAKRFDEFQRRGYGHLSTELWKYCAMYRQRPRQQQQQQQRDKNGGDGAGSRSVLYLDLESPLLVRLQDLLASHPDSNIAVSGESYMSGTVHGSLLRLRADQIETVAGKMLQLLVRTPVDVLANNHVLIPRTLYALIIASTGGSSNNNNNSSSSSTSSWYFLEQDCMMESLPRRRYYSSSVSAWTTADSYRLSHRCPQPSSFCCSVFDEASQHVIQMTRHPLHPLPEIGFDDGSSSKTNGGSSVRARRPYNSIGRYDPKDIPYMSTVTETILHESAARPKSMGLFDELLRNNCLPTEKCNDCLRDFAGGCEQCAMECSCYCRTLCQFQTAPPYVSKRLLVSPPPYSRDPNRLIPRIVHQLTPEDLAAPDAEHYYPDTSRVVQTFRKSGWEYRYYLEQDVENFLSTHFPKEILSAYRSMVPRELKLDLFRYCVLLVHGGVFANVDVMLDASLDEAIEPDVGFLVPTDNETEGCLWTGFIGTTPGHSFIAKAIETLVNQVQNRYSLVDIDYSMCPEPDLYSTRLDKVIAFSSCLLAKSVNSVMGEDQGTAFEHGDLPMSRESSAYGKTHRQAMSLFPGRVVVLDGNRQDMGGHRFTLRERNLVVAEADVRVLEDLSDNHTQARDMGGPYEFDTLYVDKERSYEDIRIYVNMPL